MEKVIISWSGGKDSAFCLHQILNANSHQIQALVTNVTIQDERVKMQGIRLELLRQQAASLGIPLEIVQVSDKPKNSEYETKTSEIIEKFKKQGASAMVFGDLYLEDIKKYRDQCLKKWGFTGLYPIWLKNTRWIAEEMIRCNFRIIVTCVDTTQLDQSFCGREFTQDFLDELPPSVDPCGEGGEFHTFVFDGPDFDHSIEYERAGFFMKDDRFYYCDLIPSKKLEPLHKG